MDSIFGLDSANNSSEDLELLTTVYDEISLACVKSILRDAEIPYLVKQRGSGSSVRIIAGYSIFGADIFVLRETLETAQALIAPVDEDELVEEAEETNEEENA